MAQYFPDTDADLVIWLDNFLKVASANLATLGLVADDLKNTQSLQPTYIANLNTVEQKRTEYAFAVGTKDANKTKLIQNFKIIVNKIQANPTISVALKMQLGISTREGGQYPAIPNPPGNLSATMLSDGSIKLAWLRNGNAPRLQYAIEILMKSEIEWKLLDVCTTLTYIDKTHKPGNETKYRVIARRGKEKSLPSNEVVVL